MPATPTETESHTAQRSRTRHAFALLAAIGLLAGGCGGEIADPQGPASAATTEGVPEQPPVAPIREVEVPPARLASLLAETSGAQRAILEDGIITFAEYEQVTLATVACYEENGAQVMSYPWMTRPPEPGLRLVGRGLYLYLAAPRVGADELAAVEAGHNCEVTHSRTIQETWVALTAPTIEELQRLRDAVAACARERGADIPEHPTRRDLANLAYPPDAVPRGRPMDPVYVDCAIPVALANNIYVPSVGF